MKKILLLALMVLASMGFAADKFQVVGRNYFGSTFEPRFYIKNVSGRTVNGFKIYAYYAALDYSVEPELDGSYEIKDDPAKKDYKHDLEGRVHKVRLIFDNTVLKNGEEYHPNTDNRFFVIRTKAGQKKTTTWHEFPESRTSMKNIVIEDLNGNILYGEHPDMNKKRVAMLNSLISCPSGNAYDGVIHIDAENTRSDSKFDKGDKHPIGVVVNNGDVNFYYCAESYSKLPGAKFNYAVISLDDACPVNSYRVKRHHDADDSKPNNYTNGIDWANSFGKDVDLYFCFVPAASNAQVDYPVDKKYGLFANYESDNIIFSRLKVDDEDWSNGNSWWYSTAAEKYKSDIKKIMDGSDNTYYRLVKWENASAAKAVAKNVVVSAEQSSNVNVPAAAKPVATAAAKPVAIAAAIKGLTREALSVELKTAGDVEVSLVGINGKVFAKFSAQNLQRGINNINWNSTNVPAGHYIVSVKHNGMISGKNVLLK
ncbi:MAG: hypothetical protein MJZ25_03270 [Fibrobacter sp.]|nr:hypothetical protein [Fibrobacter sp.]